MLTMVAYLGKFCSPISHDLKEFCDSEWSEIEDALGTPLQIAGGCIDRYG